MSDPLRLDHPGAFQSALRWLGRTGYAVRDVLHGNFGGAARQLGDFALEPIDALLPGDQIPTLSGEGDYTEASDLTGGMQDGLLKKAVDILGGAATDPLTYLSFGAAPALGAASKIAGGAAKANRAAGGIRAGIPFVDKLQKTIPGTEGRAWDPLSLIDQGYQQAKAKLPQGAQDFLSNAGIKTRAAMGMPRVAPGIADTVGQARAQEELTQRAGAAHIGQELAGFSDQAKQHAYWVINNVIKGQEGKYAEIHPDAGPINPIYTAGKQSAELSPAAAASDVASIESRADLYPREVPRSEFSSDLNPDPRWQRDLATGALPDEELEQWVRHYLQKEIPDLKYPGIRPMDAALGIKSMTGKPWKEDTTLDALNQAIGNLAQRSKAEGGLTADELSAMENLDRYKSWVERNGVDPATRPDFTSQNILRQAYPTTPTEPKFASGIDLANQAVQGGADAKLFKEGQDLGPGELLPTGMGGDEALNLVRSAESGALPEAMRPAGSALEQLLGRAETRPTSPRVELPTSVTGAVNEAMGGAKAETQAMGAASAPKLAERFDTTENIMARWNQRIDALPGVDAAQKQEIRDLLGKVLPYTQRQFKEAVDKGAFFRPQGMDLERMAPTDYLQRSYTGFMPEMDKGRFGNASSIKERVLPTGKKFADWLNENPTIQPEADLVKALAKRAQQQGSLAKRASIGKDLIEEKAAAAQRKQVEGFGQATLSKAEEASLKARGSSLADSEFSPAVDEIIKEIHDKGDRESAKYLYDAYHGLPPRGPVMEAISKLNVPFKKAAVMGILIPRWTANVRNRISAGPQVAATPGAEAAVRRAVSPMQIGRDLLGALDDASKDTFGWRIKGSELTDTLNAVDDAFKNSGGVAENAVAALRKSHPDVAGALERGVLDGFVSNEELVSQINRTGWKKTFGKFMDAPAKIFKGVEDRMRLGSYLDLIKKGGKTPDEAAKLVEEAFFDYRITSPENRNLRTLLPFAQFMAKAIPQQGKWISRQPGVGVALDQVYGQHGNEPIYPWLSDQASIPLGRDDQGNLQVAAGFGLPWEVLNSIPNPSGSLPDFGRDLERSFVSSSQPGLKSLYGIVSGHDPYFRSDTGSYDRIPVLHDALGSSAGSAYNTIAGTGLIQPIDTPLRMLDRLLDDRKTLGAKALEQTVGANVVSVDQERALQQLLQEALKRDPQIRKHESLYALDPDPQTQQLLQALKDQEKVIKAKKKAAAAQAGR